MLGGSRRRVEKRVEFYRRGGNRFRWRGLVGLQRPDRELLLKDGCLEFVREREKRKVVLRDMLI